MTAPLLVLLTLSLSIACLLVRRSSVRGMGAAKAIRCTWSVPLAPARVSTPSYLLLSDGLEGLWPYASSVDRLPRLLILLLLLAMPNPRTCLPTLLVPSWTGGMQLPVRLSAVLTA